MKKYANEWPYRQHDPRWKSEIMWARDTIIEIATQYNGFTIKRAKDLLWDFASGNTIGNEGCLITCLAMILKLLCEDQSWNPGLLNKFAHEELYYSPSGLSMTTLYADIVSEASDGKVQLILKEEYHSGNRKFPKIFASNCIPLQAYISLPKTVKTNYSIMLKIGTYDDTFASHFVLVDPKEEKLQLDDIIVLDPYKPLRSNKTWRLSDSCRRFCQDRDVRNEWNHHDIKNLQLAGVWLFAAWKPCKERMIGERIFKVLSKLLS